MNCQQARVLMSAAVDGELTPDEQKNFDLHISKCTSCFEEFTDAQRTKNVLREKIVRFKAPQALVNSILKLCDG